MSSKRVEDVHSSELDKLMSGIGLTCVRSVQSVEEYEEIGEVEEAIAEEEEQAKLETLPEEEGKHDYFVEGEEEGPGVFPTPSLRKVLPDKLREIQDFNIYNVLPDEFNTEIDPQMIPKINQTAPQKYIDMLAEITGCSNYKISLSEFWFLDTLANVLRRGQEDQMKRNTQATLILWFCEWMKEMQYFDAADRKRMIRRFKDNMSEAAKFIAEENRVPSPKEIGVYYKAVDKLETEPEQEVPALDPLGPSSIGFKETAYECAMRDLTNITHYIYDLFSTDYQYDLIRSVFTFTPDYVVIDAPYQLQIPKGKYAPLKVRGPKKDKSPKPNKEKGKKGAPIVPDTEDYLALIAMKIQEERELEEKQQQEAEEWNRRSKILPLNMAPNIEEMYNKYWPPPPPPTPPPVIAEIKKPGKKKK